MVRCSECYVLLDDLLLDTLEDNPIAIPSEVQGILYELALRYLLDKPEDVLEYCYNYMKHLSETRPTKIIVADKEPEDVLEESYWKRRPAICVPEEDDIETEITHKSDEEREFITKALADVVPFKHLDSESFRCAVDLMRHEEVESGQYITVQGDVCKCFYLIKCGLYTAYVTEDDYVKKVKSYENTGHFGEIALMHDTMLSETVMSNSMGGLWTLDGKTFRETMARQDRATRESTLPLLRRVPMFVGLTEEELWSLMDRLPRKEYEDGERLMREGDPANHMYLIISGKVAISKVDSETRRNSKHAELNDGDWFGEKAIVSSDNYNFTARTVGHTTLLVIDVDVFQRLIGSCLLVMKREFETYDQILQDIFGNDNVANLR